MIAEITQEQPENYVIFIAVFQKKERKKERREKGGRLDASKIHKCISDAFLSNVSQNRSNVVQQQSK